MSPSFPTVGPDKDFPNRPDTLDFDMLSALVMALDAEADEAGKDFDLNSMVSPYVDPGSLAYLAFQRAIRVLKIKTGADVIAKMDDLIRMSTIYHDGFILGCRFWQAKGNKKERESDGQQG